jgi:D-alanyl-D-alanine dipeptidase
MWESLECKDDNPERKLDCKGSKEDSIHREPNLDWLQDIFDAISKVPKGYREWYYKQKVEETWDPIVYANEWGIKWEDVYGKYANTTIQDLLISKKLELVLDIPWDINLDDNDVNDLKFDNYNWLSITDKEIVIRRLCKKKWIKITGDISKNLDSIRDLLILSYNNWRLKSLWISQKIEIRKDIAERLVIANRWLQGTWFSIWISNWLRTSEIQKTIKENHEFFKWKAEANRLFASEDNSPHLSWWSVDIYLIKDGKKLDLKLWENTPESNSPLYNSNNPDEQERIKYRNIMLIAMTNAWFVVNPTEYWHFAYWDKMWAYIEETTKWKPTVAMYDVFKRN